MSTPIWSEIELNLVQKLFFAGNWNNMPNFSLQELLVDFKQCAKLGYILSLSMQTALEAFKDVDPSSMGTNPEEMMEAVNRIIANWIEKSPEKANQIAHDLVLVVQEFENLQRKWMRGKESH